MLFQFGVALGFLIPPLLVRNHDSLEDIGTDLAKLNYLLAAGPTLVLILTIFCKYSTQCAGIMLFFFKSILSFQASGYPCYIHLVQ